MAKIKGNYAFIDSQNLNLGVASAGWKLDFQKFRLYLKNKFNISKAYLFVGMKPGNERMYQRLQEMGYILIFKPTIRYVKDGQETVKGNVDAELVLYASAIEFANYHKAVIVSGDGDFACLMAFLVEHNKLLNILTPNSKYSQLLKNFAPYIIRVDQLEHSLAYTKDRHQRSVETLGLSGRGDTQKITKKRSNVNRKKTDK